MPQRKNQNLGESHPSQRYQHRSNDLWEQQQQGLIDDSKYLELLEQNKFDEINNENNRLQCLVVSALREKAE